MRKLKVAAVMMSLCLAALLAPGSAAARTITLGSELIAPQTQTALFSNSTATVANTEPSGPESVAFSPAAGRVVRWRLAPQPGSDVYTLSVLHPDGSGAYTATATSVPEVASSSVTEVFTTALPIQAGDLVGLNIQSLAPQASLQVPIAAGAQLVWSPVLPLGGPAVASTPFGGIEFEFNADVQPAPQVTLIAPASGPVAGGTTVTIAGRDFTRVSGVSFGSAPASSFVVDSENEITAIAPPAVDGAGPVDVTVTGAVGTSAAVSGGQFTYLAPPASPPAPTPAPTPASTSTPAPTCTVPRLTGKTLPISRKILARSRCRLGAVRGRRRSGTKITKQSPRPGIVRPAGWAVNVTIR